MAVTLQFQPTRVTYWAAKNIVPAVSIIVLVEILKFLIGFYIGKNAFPTFSADSLSFATIIIAVSVFVSQNYFKEKVRSSTQKQAFDWIAKGNFTLFFASFLLSIIAGNQWSRIENPASKANVFATVTEERVGEINGDSLLNVIQQEQQQLNDSKTVKPDENDNDDLQRLGYFGLFILAIALTYVGLALACGLACSGYGIFAVLLFLIDIGIFGGGIYFLMKVFKKGRIKRLRDMDKTERKKEFKRYLLTTLVSVVVAALFTIIVSYF